LPSRAEIMKVRSSSSIFFGLYCHGNTRKNTENPISFRFPCSSVCFRGKSNSHPALVLQREGDAFAVAGGNYESKVFLFHILRSLLPRKHTEEHGKSYFIPLSVFFRVLPWQIQFPPRASTPAEGRCVCHRGRKLKAFLFHILRSLLPRKHTEEHGKRHKVRFSVFFRVFPWQMQFPPRVSTPAEGRCVCRRGRRGTWR